MMRHIVLGLLREGVSRHGYQLMVMHRQQSGEQISTGTFYRELAWLTAHGFVTTTTTATVPGDPRRIPYAITEHGRRVFDEWLHTPDVYGPDRLHRLLFLDRLLPEALDALLQRWEEDLFIQARTLVQGHAPEDASRPRLPGLLAWRSKQLAAELEFVAELRRSIVAHASERSDRPESPPKSRAGGRETRPTAAHARVA